MTRDEFFLFSLLNWHFFNMQLEVLIKLGNLSTIISSNIAFSSFLEKTYLSFKTSIINILEFHYIIYVIYLLSAFLIFLVTQYFCLNISF